MDIKSIFYDAIFSDNENIIKTIPINWNQHSIGIINIAKNLVSNFEINKNNKPILKLLLMYFTGNELFCDELEKLTGQKGSLSKGLYIVGNVGTGKTILVKTFKEYTKNILSRNSFHFINEIDLINLISVEGTKAIDYYGYNSGNPITLYIDDFCSKNQKVKFYGQEIDVLDNLLTIRYIVFTKYKKLTHISTNKFPSELLKIYDNRLIDRFVEMFNIVELNGNSFRN